MKILHCIYDHENNPWVGGGGARRVSTLYGLLQGRGHEITIVAGRYPGCEDSKSNHITRLFVGSDRSYFRSTFAYARAARQLALRRAREFDLVVEDFAPWNPLFLPRHGDFPPVILQLQSCFGTQILRRYSVAGLPFFLLEKIYPRRFRHHVVIAGELNLLYGIRGEVISNGVDPDYLRETPVSGDYVAYMGRLDFHVKGIDLLLEAVRGLQIPLKIAGDGAERERLRQALPGLPQVEWVGTLAGREKVDFLRRARFVVVPSRSEGQNMVVLESAALGKCCLVSDIRGLNYGVEAGFALPFANGSATALRSGMETLWHDASLRARLESRGRPWMENLTWPRLADRFESYCMNVLRNPGGMASL